MVCVVGAELLVIINHDYGFRPRTRTVEYNKTMIMISVLRPGLLNVEKLLLFPD